MTTARTHHHRRPGRPAGGQSPTDRIQLLDAAERCIAASGPDVSMEAIAAEAGVTKPVLYRGVGDKDALVGALAERFVDRINGAITAATADEPDPRRALVLFVTTYFTVVETHRSLFLFILGGAPGNDPHGRALHLADRSAAPMARSLADSHPAAAADPELARVWAYGLIGMLNFVTLWWLRDEQVGIDHLSSYVADLMWHGVGGGDAHR